MILGIGTDIVSVNRVREVFNEKVKVERFFSVNERLINRDNSINYEKIAGRFAAKEALVKAMGTGFTKITLKDIEILNEESGRPYFSSKTKKLIEDRLQCNIRIHISLSHERDFAIAYCILEKI